MAIDPEKETLFPLNMAVKFAPRSSQTGKYLHSSALRRWATDGLKGPQGERIYLETLTAGGLVTSREAIGRFLKKRAMLLDRARKLDTRPTTLDREKAKARAAHDLDAAGI